jgi:hypothetical protein
MLMVLQVGSQTPTYTIRQEQAALAERNEAAARRVDEVCSAVCALCQPGPVVHYSFIHSFYRSLVHSSIHLFVRSFIHSFIHAFMRASVTSSTTHP